MRVDIPANAVSGRASIPFRFNQKWVVIAAWLAVTIGTSISCRLVQSRIAEPTGRSTKTSQTACTAESEAKPATPGSRGQRAP